MRIENNCVSFLSNIKLITPQEFKSLTKHYNPKRHEVGWPWTADTMKKGKNLFTTGILDCIAGGIVDGKDFVMFHLGIYNQEKARKNHQKGFNIANVERRLLEKINLENENLHGFILGGVQMRPESKYNVNKLKKIKEIFEKYNIPYTIFGARKDVHYFGKFGMFYKNKEDTLYITNNLIGTDHINKKYKQKEIEILPNRLVKYTTYTKEQDERILWYKPTFRVGAFQDFFESQFRDVFVSKQDEFI